MPEPAKEFLEQLQSGQGFVRKICRVYGESAEDREDLYQDIVFNAWRSYQTFRGDAKFSTWLYRVALNTALMHRRKAVTRRTSSLDDHPNLRDKESSLPEDMRLLYDAIHQLHPVERSLMVLYLDDMPYKEIAEVLGITENHVSVKVLRVKEKLKKILKSYGVG